MKRAMQLTLHDDLGEPQPAERIIGSVIGGTNAELIRAIAPLYLTESPVVDLTYGRGGWWKSWRPDELVAHDLTLDGVDFTNLPEATDTYAATCYDPPYVPACGQGTSTLPDFRNRFGLEPYRSQIELDEMIVAGLNEAVRVTRPGGYVLVKCCDYVNARQFTSGLPLVLAAAGPRVTLWDLIVHDSGGGPGGHHRYEEVRRTRRAHSYLVVFRRLEK